MNKFLYVIALAGVTALTGFAAKAAEVSEDATLIIYRADESFRTERINMDVYLGRDSLTRMKAERVSVTTHPAGTYTLDTSMPGSKPLQINLKPGATHYVYTDLDMRGSVLSVELVEVEEQVARVHKPNLEEAI